MECGGVGFLKCLLGSNVTCVLSDQRLAWLGGSPGGWRGSLGREAHSPGGGLLVAVCLLTFPMQKENIHKEQERLSAKQSPALTPCPGPRRPRTQPACPGVCDSSTHAGLSGSD